MSDQDQRAAFIKSFVDHFMMMKMPPAFAPDGYISFDRVRALEPNRWPIGTNLFDVEMAQKMFGECYDAAQANAQPSAECADLFQRFEQTITQALSMFRAEHDELVAAREVIRTLKTPNDPQGANLKAALAAYDKVCERIPEPKE